MSAKATREYYGKRLIAKYVREVSEGMHVMDDRSVLVTPETDFDLLAKEESWLSETDLVVKPDQLIKRRGKLGLIGMKLSWDDTKGWISERMNKEIKIGNTSGVLDHFIINPFVPHLQSDEYYVCIRSNRDGEEMMFCPQGGINVGDVETCAFRMEVEIDDDSLSVKGILASDLLQGLPKHRTEILASFLLALFKVYRMLNFTFMEINPLVYTSNGKVVPLDLAAKLDETAAFLNSSQWGYLEFPPPFGKLFLRSSVYHASLGHYLNISSFTVQDDRITQKRGTFKSWTPKLEHLSSSPFSILWEGFGPWLLEEVLVSFMPIPFVI